MRTMQRMLASIWTPVLLLSACASGPDRFYSVQPLPAPAVGAGQQFSAEATIRVAVPSVMDRNQIVLDLGGTIQVLEHERWAAPLSDQLTTALGQDLEQRRPDILITSRPLSQGTGLPRFAIQVELVSLSMRRSGPVQMEVRWQIESSPDRSISKFGREIFAATSADSSAAALAAAISRCVASLADRLAPTLNLSQP